MVLYSAHNAKGPVDLFVKHQTSELVRQRHRTEGKLFADMLENLRVQPEIGAEEKDDRVGPRFQATLKPAGEVL